MTLAREACAVCDSGTEPLHREVCHRLLAEIPGWILKEKSIVREFSFPDFGHAIAFINRVADIAEQQKHHPDIHVYYNRVVLELSTHSAHGLTRNDFIVAAKVNATA